MRLYNCIEYGLVWMVSPGWITRLRSGSGSRIRLDSEGVKWVHTCVELTYEPMKRRHLGRLPGFTHVFEGTRAQIDLNLNFVISPLPILPRFPVLFNLSSPFFTPLLPLPILPPSLYLMDPSRKDILPYTASCNPPRKAKRPNTTGPTLPPDRSLQSLPPLAPAIASITTDVMRPPDNEDMSTEVPQPKRRGRKPSSLSRAARESMRRQNHSRIEKARRTKINDALAMLRDLVPADVRRKLPIAGDDSIDEDDEDDDFGPASSKKPGGKNKQRQEKEFKLEILEKAVLYVQELHEKVRALEARGCARCSNASTSVAHRPKRKHEAMPSSDDYDSHSSLDTAMDRPAKRISAHSIFPPPPSSPPTASAPAPGPSTRLPSISSWLPRSIAELGISESHTPSVNSIQLPTPPASGVIGPIASPQVPPTLRLELPMASLSTRTLPPSAQSSPSWTTEEESAASLLLRMKTSNSPKTAKHRTSISDLLAPIPGAPRTGDKSRSMGVDEMRVQTPGSLLGMPRDGPN